jgi:hypothetical protein
MDELTGQLIEHISHLHAVMSTPVSGKLQAATMSLYGPDGTTEAKQISANYQNVNFDTNGNITGGTLQYSAQAQQIKLSENTASLGANGRPAAIASTIFDQHSGAPYRSVQTDLSGLTWTAAARIQTGSIKVTSSNPADQTLLTSGTMAFNNEQLQQIALTHHAPDSTGVVQGSTTIDYSNVQFSGDETIGGHQVMTTQRPDQTVSSQSQLFYSNNGLPTTMHTSGYADNGTGLNSNTLTNYSAVTFDARRQIFSGQLTSTTSDPQNIVRAKTTVSYANGVPQSAETQNFSAKGILVQMVRTDYTGSTFNNAKHVVNSAITVNRLRPNGTLISSARVMYDKNGCPLQHLITNYRANGEAVSQTEVSYAAARFDHHRKVVNGQVTATTTTADGATQTSTVRHYNSSRNYTIRETLVQHPTTKALLSSSKIIKRVDGTVAEVIIQTSPQAATITQYGTDGTTVIKCIEVDYSNATVAGGNILSGNVGITARDHQQKLLATSNLAYASQTARNNLGQEIIPLTIINQTSQSNLYLCLMGTTNPNTPEHNWYYLSDFNGNVTQCSPTDSTNYCLQIQANQSMQLPQLSGIRLYFSFGKPLAITVGSNGIPNSPVGWVKDANFETLFDWIEVTWSVNSPTDMMMSLNTDQIDMFGFPITFSLQGFDPSGNALTQQGGFSAGVSRQKTISAFKTAPSPWNNLVITEGGMDLRVISPEHGMEDQMGLFPKNQSYSQNNLYQQILQSNLMNGGAVLIHNALSAQIVLSGF